MSDIAVHRIVVDMGPNREPRGCTVLPKCTDAEARKIAEGVFTAARVISVERLVKPR